MTRARLVLDPAIILDVGAGAEVFDHLAVDVAQRHGPDANTSDNCRRRPAEAELHFQRLARLQGHGEKSRRPDRGRPVNRFEPGRSEP